MRQVESMSNESVETLVDCRDDFMCESEGVSAAQPCALGAEALVSGLSSMQRSLYQLVADSLPVTDAGINHYEIEGSLSDEYWVASGALDSAASARLTVSLPELSHTVFLCVSGGLQPIFEQLLCDVNAQSESDDTYRAGYAHRLAHRELNRLGWTGLLFVSAKEYFDTLPEMIEIEGEVIDFVLVIPITEAEFRVYKKQGYKSLRSHFSIINRDVLDGHERLVSSEAHSCEELPSDVSSADVPAQGARPQTDESLTLSDRSKTRASSQLTSLRAIGRSTGGLTFWEKMAFGGLGVVGLIGAAALGVLPAVFAAAGTMVLIDACKDMRDHGWGQ